MENEKCPVRHDVALFDRSRMHLTGVVDVSSFDENGILLELGEESISIEGEKLHIESFDGEKAELTLTGHVTGFFYFKRTPKKAKRSFWGRS